MDKILENRKDIKAKFGILSTIKELELKGDFQKYLCIIISGHYEQSVKELVLQYVGQQSNGSLNILVEKRVLKYQSSFKFEELSKLLQVLLSTDEWKESLVAKIKEEIKNQIAALIDTRNKLAHGENSDIKEDDISSWFKAVNTVLSILEETLQIKQKHPE